jgi:hypothetical protein
MKPKKKRAFIILLLAHCLKSFEYTYIHACRNMQTKVNAYVFTDKKRSWTGKGVGGGEREKETQRQKDKNGIQILARTLEASHW